ncbi:MAG: DUF1971 domain-containing protein [Planctomycetaceae bacterium]|jgi:tellurite resistance-related uncharacterized protein|nr:DUF1971 domain-containing protein [Planctomycetaceae bacterium]
MKLIEGTMGKMIYLVQKSEQDTALIQGRTFQRMTNMNYQKAQLPEGAVLAGTTPTMTEETIVPGILANHMAPKGKCGLLVVEEGACRFVWEDDLDNPIDCDPDHPVVIFPERFHHVAVTGPVKLRVEFYSQTQSLGKLDPSAVRPGKDFI